MIRREHRRLDRAFSALLLALAPSAAAQACNSATPADSTPVNELDAQQYEAAPPDDPIDSAKKPIDAGPDIKACSGSVHVHDASVAVLDADAGEADADIGCDYAFPCGLPPGVLLVGCDIWVPYPDGAPAGPLGCSVIGQGCDQDAFVPDESGAISFTCIDCVGGGGRKPSGLRKTRPVQSRSARGAYFARMAYDEAASVHAFTSMRDELAFHGAPSVLVNGAARAAKDETRHARLMTVHAQAEGTAVPKVRIRRRSAPRTIAAIALENAVEGCVRETFGALLLRWQAAHSEDAALRRTFERIAKDEARHAALSWAVARWAEEHLDAKARQRIANARVRALRSLAKTAASAADLALDHRSLGRPTANQIHALVTGFGDALGLAS